MSSCHWWDPERKRWWATEPVTRDFLGLGELVTCCEIEPGAPCPYCGQALPENGEVDGDE